ncbi:HK97 family phage prohead protease [Anaerorhabdus furcosa]|uniref:Prohead serine protease domain-containing protein n=1 Tax=Anaerorhabdus furcosa TaxID=118967 RepID=A0A1T4M157_9FIRM|nr:HK97 family phage prohead protease [Anaerorhabdus furcosa]SJZ60617.1 hypothetical protein SAMN02745191_1136 [Anaerorhabdus furcosa]
MISKDREYRQFNLEPNEEMHASGYACIFESPTVMYEMNGIQYKEVIDRKAFDNCEMRDVVMNYNHGGKPVARTKNGTLKLLVDATGLKIDSDLSGTDEARKLHEEIKGGYIDKMSFAFIVSKDEYDRETHTRRITGIKRLYDVAAVDIPAYDTTSISARSFFQAEAEKEVAEANKCKMRLRKLKLKMEAMK